MPAFDPRDLDRALGALESQGLLRRRWFLGTPSVRLTRLGEELLRRHRDNERPLRTFKGQVRGRGDAPTRPPTTVGLPPHPDHPALFPPYILGTENGTCRAPVGDPVLTNVCGKSATVRCERENGESTWCCMRHARFLVSLEGRWGGWSIMETASDERGDRPPIPRPADPDRRAHC